MTHVKDQRTFVSCSTAAVQTTPRDTRRILRLEDRKAPLSRADRGHPSAWFCDTYRPSRVTRAFGLRHIAAAAAVALSALPRAIAGNLRDANLCPSPQPNTAAFSSVDGGVVGRITGLFDDCGYGYLSGVYYTQSATIYREVLLRLYGACGAVRVSALLPNIPLFAVEADPHVLVETSANTTSTFVQCLAKQVIPRGTDLAGLGALNVTVPAANGTMAQCSAAEALRPSMAAIAAVTLGVAVVLFSAR